MAYPGNPARRSRQRYCPTARSLCEVWGGSRVSGSWIAGERGHSPVRRAITPDEVPPYRAEVRESGSEAGLAARIVMDMKARNQVGG